jgi:hypothetical protein
MIGRRGLLGAAVAPALPRGAAAAAPAEVPRRSDVIFSTRWARAEAPAVAHAFGATRLDWCYTADPRFVATMRGAGLHLVGGTVNANLTDRPGVREYAEGRILDRDGAAVAAPWMRGWGVAWGCANAPAYRAAWVAHARAALEAGASHLTMDDPRMNEAAAAWGGCWCPHCRARAEREGVDLSRDMRAFARRSVTRFVAEVRAEIDRAAGRRVTLSCNNFRGDLGWPHDLYDFGLGELPGAEATPDRLAGLLRAAEAAGRVQAFTLTSEDVALNRRVIAWCYAHGGLAVVPWDVYLRSTPTGSERFFGRPEDFAPLYRMARALGPMLDGAEDAGMPPAGAWSADLPGLRPSLRVVRHRGPSLLHLVPWETEGRVSLRLDAATLAVGAGEVRLPDGPAVPLRREGRHLAATLPPAPWYAAVLLPG